MTWSTPISLEKRSLLGAAGRSDDGVAFDLGDLTDDRADGAGRSRDKHHVAGLQRRDLQQAHPGGEARHAGDAEERLRRQPERVELLHVGGRRVECLAPAQHRRDEIAALEPRIVGRDNFADGAALQRLPQLKGRDIARAIDHAAAHIRIDRHPQVLHLDFAGRGIWHRHGGQLEIFGTRHAGRAGFQTDFARRDHDREPLCCRISGAELRGRIGPGQAAPLP